MWCSTDWAERILPVVHDAGPDPRDGITGVYGLRYRITGSSVELYRPGSSALIRLEGFNRRWWELAAARRRLTANATFDLPQWTGAERLAVRLVQEDNWEPAQLLSPLLRRIRATASGGPCNNTSTWFNDVALRVETTFGPVCAEMTALLCQGPTALGWTVEREHCVCHLPAYKGSCIIEFSAPGQPPIHYSSLRWDSDDLSEEPGARIAELNARALRP